MKAKHVSLVLITVAAIGISGCKSAPKHEALAAAPQGAQKTGDVTVQIQPKSGSKVTGALILSDTDKGLHIVGDLTGLSKGKHGIHVHEKGDCSAADASSAGSHFGMAGQTHGAPGKHESHTGDLGNIKAGKNGEAKIDETFPGLTLAAVSGRSIVVHAKKDDYKTQPAGASGDKVGCGEIK